MGEKFKDYLKNVLFVTFLDRDSTQAIADVIAFSNLYIHLDFNTSNKNLVHFNDNYWSYVPLSQDFLLAIINILKIKKLVTISITANDESALNFYEITKTYPNLCLVDYTVDFRNSSFMEMIAHKMQNEHKVDILFIYATKSATNGLKKFLEIFHRLNVTIKTCFANDLIDKNFIGRSKYHISFKTLKRNDDIITNYFDYSLDTLNEVNITEFVETNYIYKVFMLTTSINRYLNYSNLYSNFASEYLELYKKPFTLLTLYRNGTDIKPYSLDDFHSYEKDSKLCPIIICKPGYEPKMMTVVDENSIKIHNWKCIPCQNNHVKKNVGSNECIACSKYCESNDDKTKCINVFKNRCLNSTDFEGMVVIVLSVLGSLYCLCTMLIYVVQRKTSVVKTGNLMYSVIQLLTHLLIFIIIPNLYINTPVLATCSVRHLVLGFLFTVLAAITCIKTRKYIKIFKLNHRITTKEKIVSSSVDFLIALVLIIFQGALGGVLFIYKPPTLNISWNYKTMTKDFNCSTDVSFTVQAIYIEFVLLLSAFQALQARNLPSFFNETASITYGTWISCIILSCYFPIYYSSQDGKSKAVAISLTMAIVNISLMTLKFTPRIVMIYFKPKNNKMEFKFKMINQ
ncbi:metabotropic glutamate receptor 5-like [Hydra vulgaris]|uniref:metabotropic glutamate receptor 5-like n=1 Tax=Hydra vulgaris TaxID=6087 RepID=UPI0032EA59E3